MREVLVWVPLEPVAAALAGLDGVRAEVVAPDGSPLPESGADVQFYVPPFFPSPESVQAMAQLPSLAVVQTLTAGFDLVRPHVPGSAVLCNARGVHDASTAEWAIGATIAALRQFPYFSAEQAAGRWSFRFTDCLAGKKVLIVGYGSIGQAVERRLAGFEVQVSRVARTGRDGVSPVSALPELLPEADVVILLAPVTKQTVGMVDAAFLARMKDGALLVNAARGVLVVTDDLVAELAAGRLSAAMDVAQPEPLPPGHPLWSAPNVLITPHVAASTPFSISAALSFVAAQAGRYIRGEPLLNVITGEY
ncbi:MAG TPA: 2-hydroxyacid dehydrogenase [Streptosporangiaceae bacterium]